MVSFGSVATRHREAVKPTATESVVENVPSGLACARKISGPFGYVNARWAEVDAGQTFMTLCVCDAKERRHGLPRAEKDTT